MTTHIAAPRAAPRRSVYDFVPMGLVKGLFFRILLLVAPIQSVLLTPVQGTTPAFLLTLLSPVVLVSSDPRYFRLLLFYAGIVFLYALYMGLSLWGYTYDQPDLSRVTVIREVFIYGYLKQSHVTQGVYLIAALLFCYLVYNYYQEAFIKFAFFGIIILAIYGFYEFVYYAILQENGDFLSNRNFGDLERAAAGTEGGKKFLTGSLVQQSNIFGSGFIRLKSLTGEPSMYSLTVVPFAVYAFGRRWWYLFAILLASLVLSTSTTGIIGLAVGIAYVEIRHRQEAILYVAAAVFTVALLYFTADPVQGALDKLLFQKLESTSGNDRLQFMINHASVPFDGNVIRFLFGLGFGTVRSTDMLSNLLANVGVIGLMLYSAVILLPCFLLRKSVDRDAVIATLLAIFFMEMLTVSEYAYLPPWFMVALGYARLRQQRLAGAMAPLSATRKP